MSQDSSEILLATDWPISKVQRCLDGQETENLISFLRQRYDERFFQPICQIRSTAGNEQGYGMAIMALCSLLIESIQCCRDGLPSTHDGELKKLAKHNPPQDYEVPKGEWKKCPIAFRDFFVDYASLFPDVSGEEFYDSIRNGLLHQAQTKNGWTIRVFQAKLCEPTKKIIDRNLFADALERAFTRYLKELRESPQNSDLWQNARRKIWWLIRLSQ